MTTPRSATPNAAHPGATYRLQFNRDFPLRAARAIVPYLDRLGVSAVYALPLQKARAGSMHGYDVVDYGSINPEIGTEEEFVALAEELRARGMGLLFDVVPNHMCIADPANRWWADVLENGPGSPYARFFDIDWHPPKPDLADKVLLPILGEQYGRTLENGELTVHFGDGGFSLHYGPTLLPLAPRTWVRLLDPLVALLRDRVGRDDARVLELESIVTALDHLPPRTETDPGRVRVRQREKEIARQRLAALAADADVAAALDRVLDDFNGHRGDPRSFDRLEALLAEQAYRLSFWRVATDEINYRRFFDINELAAVRVEESEVFQAVHELPFRYARQGLVTGLRIDHVDGLLDPQGYLDAVQRELTGPDGRPFYVVVEKILTGAEQLRPDWATAGTTGYEYLALVNGAFTDPDGFAALRLAYQRITGRDEAFADLLYEARRLVLQVSLSSELTVLARRLDRISEQHRYSRDFTLNSLRHVVREIVAAFPVYRSYIRPGVPQVEPGDREVIERAVRAAIRRNPAVNRSIFHFVGEVLLLRDVEGLDSAAFDARRDFVLRFQQLTAPVMAKGLEDTAFYRYYPLASLNDVGAGPAPAAVSAAEFHLANRAREQHRAFGLLASTTHDTKRSEDVRARMVALAEMPGQWEELVTRWREANAARRMRLADGTEAPDANEEYLLYQTLVGAWPLRDSELPAFGPRIQQYMQKALREAKQHTSWINPDDEYEQAVASFIDGVLAPAPDNAVLAELRALVRRLVRPGLWTALSQLVLKVAAPGVPDFYQGTETWTFSLVDPDNRRPVDYHRRCAALDELAEAERSGPVELVRRLAAAPEDDRLKLFVTWRALAARRRFRDLFEAGEYVALSADGPRERHVLAFARVLEGRSAIVVATRYHLALDSEGSPPAGAAWRGNQVTLPSQLGRGPWRDALTGRPVPVSASLDLADVLAELPLALLQPD